jgi:bifunctional non-homologous end joining protein LigD
MEQVTLYYRQGASDKIYQAMLETRNGGHVVTFAFGRRGTTLQTGTKTQAPVSYEDAKRIFEKLVHEKTAKGYTPGENGTPYELTDKKNHVAGIGCQLLNPISESEAVRLINNSGFCMQEKFDGRRLLLQKRADQVHGINRLGLFVSVSASIASAARKLGIDFLCDGEAVGERLHVFDLLKVNGADIRSESYRERYRQLGKLVKKSSGPITVLPTSFGQAEKALNFCTYKALNREGVVFKQLDAPYSAGRPPSGGPQLKVKFYETASFVIGAINQKRSASLMLFRGDQIVPAGNVTIPPNHHMPVEGAVVELKYLYAFKESGAVYQPVYLGRRDDIAVTECTVEQLKFKPEPR